MTEAEVAEAVAPEQAGGDSDAPSKPKVVTRPVKPDKQKKDKQIEKLNEEIRKQLERKQELEEVLQSKRNRGRSPRHKEIMEELRKLKGEREQLNNQRRKLRSALDEIKNNQAQDRERQKELQKRVGSLKVEDYDAQIATLMNQLEHSDVGGVQKEKELMKKIQDLYKSKQDIERIGQQLAGPSEGPERWNKVSEELTATDKRLDDLREEVGKFHEELDSIKAREESETADVPALQAERRQVQENVRALRDKKTEILDDWNEQNLQFKEENAAWNEFRKAAQQERHERFQRERAEKEAERAARRKEEEALYKGAPFDGEILRCEQLITFLAKYVPAGGSGVGENGAAQDGAAGASQRAQAAGMKVMKKKGEDEQDPFSSLTRLGGKKKGKRQGKGGTSSDGETGGGRLQLDVDSLMAFSLIKVEVPATIADIPRTTQLVQERKADYEQRRKRALAGDSSALDTAAEGKAAEKGVDKTGKEEEEDIPINVIDGPSPIEDFPPLASATGRADAGPAAKADGEELTSHETGAAAGDEGEDEGGDEGSAAAAGEKDEDADVGSEGPLEAAEEDGTDETGEERIRLSVTVSDNGEAQISLGA